MNTDSASAYIHFKDLNKPVTSGWQGVGRYSYFGSDRLTNGQTMTSGHYILSENVEFALVFQSDGNLVLYHGSKAIWNTNTDGTGANRLKMQTDGNLVLYNSTRAVWASNTTHNGSSYVKLQTDGNLVIRRNSDGQVTWNTNTDGLI